MAQKSLSGSKGCKGFADSLQQAMMSVLALRAEIDAIEHEKGARRSKANKRPASSISRSNEKTARSRYEQA